MNQSNVITYLIGFLTTRGMKPAAGWSLNNGNISNTVSGFVTQSITWARDSGGTSTSVTGTALNSATKSASSAFFALDVASFLFAYNASTTQWNRLLVDPTTGRLLVDSAAGATFANAAITVTNASQQFAAANTARKYLLIQNKHKVGTIFVNFGAAATEENGVQISPGGSYEPSTVPTNTVNIIGTEASNANVLLVLG